MGVVEKVLLNRVRLVLADETGALRINAMIAWANFEMRRPSLTPSYRAGLDFKDADSRAIARFAERHGADQVVTREQGAPA